MIMIDSPMVHPHPNPLPEGEGACWLVLMLICTLLPTPVSPPGEKGAVALMKAHDQARSTWRKSSSTGVSLPKNDTSTLTFERSWDISSTVPMKSRNGPSMMRTF